MAQLARRAAIPLPRRIARRAAGAVVRLTLGLLVPMTEHWLVGAGAMFMRVVGDAADSPIVDERGTPNQISGGLGVAYAW